MAPGLQDKRVSKESSYHRPGGDGDTYPVQPRRLSKAEARSKASLDLLNENSPLLLPQRLEGDNSSVGSDASIHELELLDGEEREESKSVWYLFVLTLSIGGFGKRRPFMVGGAAATLVSFLALAWTRDIVRGFLGLFGADPESQLVQVATICFAIGWICLLDVAINIVQAGIRAFIVDNAPTHQQEDANAWASVIVGVGNMLGYLSGYVNLPKIMPFFGNTQFKVLSVITCIALGGTVLISCLCIVERDPRHDPPPPPQQTGVLAFFKQIYRSARRLSPQIRKVCEVQFFNWIGWFPFLFYITTYIGQLHVNPIFKANPNMSPEEIDEAWESATRVGSFALLIFAITSFTSNMVLPFFVVPTYRALPPSKSCSSFHSSSSAYRNGHQSTTPAGTPLPMSASMTSFFPPPPDEVAHSRLARILSLAQIPWLTLRRAWILAHLLFAMCMALTFFITTPLAATVLVGAIGVAWALSLWAPFALIAAEIRRHDAQARRTGGTNNDQAGVVLGLHNVATSAPQVLATLVSSAIFRIAQKPRGEPGDDSVGWVLRFGGVAALVAAYMTSRLREEGAGEKVKGQDNGNGGRMEREAV
ncbi:MAG: hypothetical protein Q9211_006302 [Gyalolechia sp. 1 TL-2023]